MKYAIGSNVLFRDDISDEELEATGIDREHLPDVDKPHTIIRLESGKYDLTGKVEFWIQVQGEVFDYPVTLLK